MRNLPCQVNHVGTPPLKCQGIKTKLVAFIFRQIKWSEENGGRWIEPFVGSGVVALKVRTRFNDSGSPFDLLFLNRSCFTGVMRFNKRGKFNVPFGHKPQRFSKAYITKIANQVNWTAKQMVDKEIHWRVADWKDTLAETRSNDFVYMDPPYVGRHADYYNSWNEEAASLLASAAKQLPCGFAVSMWLQNAYRRNAHIEHCWSDMDIVQFAHLYHVGSRESLRNKMTEALIVKPGFATLDPTEVAPERGEASQERLFEPLARYTS